MKDLWVTHGKRINETIYEAQLLVFLNIQSFQSVGLFPSKGKPDLRH